jgi:transmembrane sensor
VGETPRAPTALGAGSIAHTLDGKVFVSKQTVPEVEQLLSWRSGFLSFHDTPLAQAVAEFNRYNERKIVIADASIAGILVGGNFRPSNADTFLSFLEREFPVEVEWGERTIAVKGR